VTPTVLRLPRWKEEAMRLSLSQRAIKIGAALAVLMLLLLGVGFWVHQSSAQSKKLDGLRSSQEADRAAAAQEKVAAAAAAKTKTDADAKANQDAAIAKAQKDAADAQKAAADAKKAAADANAKPPSTVVIPQYPQYYNGYVPSRSAVWGSFPLTHYVPHFVYIRNAPDRAHGYSGTINRSELVNIICSVRGETVSDANGSSDVWDYVSYPVVGYVADEFVDAGNLVAPSC
jgi:hypothetical protein